MCRRQPGQLPLSAHDVQVLIDKIENVLVSLEALGERAHHRNVIQLQETGSGQATSASVALIGENTSHEFYLSEGDSPVYACALNELSILYFSKFLKTRNPQDLNASVRIGSGALLMAPSCAILRPQLLADYSARLALEVYPNSGDPDHLRLS